MDTTIDDIDIDNFVIPDDVNLDDILDDKDLEYLDEADSPLDDDSYPQEDPEDFNSPLDDADSLNTSVSGPAPSENAEGYYDDEGHFIQGYYDDEDYWIEGYYDDNENWVVTSRILYDENGGVLVEDPAYKKNKKKIDFAAQDQFFQIAATGTPDTSLLSPRATFTPSTSLSGSSSQSSFTDDSTKSSKKASKKQDQMRKLQEKQELEAQRQTLAHQQNQMKIQAKADRDAARNKAKLEAAEQAEKLRQLKVQAKRKAKQDAEDARREANELKLAKQRDIERRKQEKALEKQQSKSERKQAKIQLNIDKKNLSREKKRHKNDLRRFESEYKQAMLAIVKAERAEIQKRQEILRSIQKIRQLEIQTALRSTLEAHEMHRRPFPISEIAAEAQEIERKYIDTISAPAKLRVDAMLKRVATFQSRYRAINANFQSYRKTELGLIKAAYNALLDQERSRPGSVDFFVTNPPMVPPKRKDYVRDSSLPPLKRLPPAKKKSRRPKRFDSFTQNISSSSSSGARKPEMASPNSKPSNSAGPSTPNGTAAPWNGSKGRKPASKPSKPSSDKPRGSKPSKSRESIKSNFVSSQNKATKKTVRVSQIESVKKSPRIVQVGSKPVGAGKGNRSRLKPSLPTRPSSLNDRSSSSRSRKRRNYSEDDDSGDDGYSRSRSPSPVRRSSSRRRSPSPIRRSSPRRRSPSPRRSSSRRRSPSPRRSSSRRRSPSPRRSSSRRRNKKKLNATILINNYLDLLDEYNDCKKSDDLEGALEVKNDIRAIKKQAANMADHLEKLYRLAKNDDNLEAALRFRKDLDLLCDEFKL